MSGWTEETLRKAASWQAYKEGRALLESGAVAEAKVTAAGWRGSVRSGGKLLRVAATVKSATDIDVHCACPENRRSGALCGHAVATGLAALAEQQSAAASPAAAPQASPPQQPAAFDVVLPPNWRLALQRGKLAATLNPALRPAGDPADAALAVWLSSHGLASKPGLQVHLDGQRAAAFLAALIGHPAVRVAPNGSPIAVSDAHLIELAEVEPSADHERIRMVPSEETHDWIEIGGTLWQTGENFLKRAGEGAIPDSLRGHLLSLSRGHDIEIPSRDLLRKLSDWQDWLAFPTGGWLESMHFVPLVPEFRLSLDGSLQRLDAKLSVSYPNCAPQPPASGDAPELPRLSGMRCEIRDLHAEDRAVRLLQHAGFQPQPPANWSLHGESAILSFLADTLPSLRKSWRVTTSSRFDKAASQVSVVSPEIVIHGSGEDWLSFEIRHQTSDGIVIPPAEIQRLIRSGKSSGRITGGRHCVVAEEYSSILDPLLAELNPSQHTGRYEVSAAAGEVISEIGKKLRKTHIESEQENFTQFRKPAALQAALRPYQELGAAWLGDRAKRYGGALLADDMGLGKTIQTIAWIESLFADDENTEGVVLVVATATLLGNWRAEFGRFAPDRRVWVLHGGGRDELRGSVRGGDVVLTSYGTLARDLAWHLGQEYLAVVVDEASVLRNPDTDHARAVTKLRSSRRVALTGTPIENGVRDLWSIFRFIQPGWLGGRREFSEHYEGPLAAGEGAGAVMERLKLKTAPFLLRRTKEQVAPELPTKLIIDEFCDLSTDQLAVYRQLLEEGRRQVDAVADAGNTGAARMRMLTALLRLRQTCCDLALLGGERFERLAVPRRSAKLEHLLELLDEAISGNHRVLVFSQFQRQLVAIEKSLAERGWSSLRLDGQTRNRHELVEKFQHPQGPPVFLISLKAGGYGLNLTAADTVIHFDPWWNPAAENQATDRAHRIGQSRPVTVYRLLTRGTVEEKVLRLQGRKRQLAAAIDEAGGGDAPGWSLADLQAVISE